MPPLVCPVCTRESSPGAYACAACSFSFVRERSKPIAKRLHFSFLVASILALIANLGLLLVFEAFTHPSLVLLFWLTNGSAALYYYNRIRGTVAKWLYFIKTPAGTEGWVSNDAFPIYLIAGSFVGTYIQIAKHVPA